MRDVAPLAEARLAVGARRLGIEVLLEPVDVAGAPRPGLAVAAVRAALGVVRVVGDVPVADVDHVQEPRLVAGEPLADRRVEEEAERAAVERSAGTLRGASSTS